MATVQEILDAEIPSPTWALNPTIAAPIRSDMTFLRPDDNPDPTARTLDPRSGKFEARGADTPRIYGGQQELLIEGNTATNHLLNSSDITVWGPYGNGFSTSEKESIIGGEKAHLVTAPSGGDGASEEAGSFTGDTECAYLILEKSSNNTSKFNVQNQTQGVTVATLEYDWDTQQIIDSTGAANAYQYEIDPNGFNGGRVKLLALRIASNASGNNSGDGRRIDFFPDSGGDGTGVIYHFGQVQNAGSIDLPIVAGGTALTRGGDQATISIDDWNTSEGTFYFEIQPIRFFEDIGAANTFGFTETNRISYVGFEYGESPHTVQAYDGTAYGAPGSISPFERARYAVSFDDDGVIRQALNGSGVEHTGATGEMASADKDIDLPKGKDSILFNTIIYYPEMLPVAEADRSSNDPLSLETLTS